MVSSLDPVIKIVCSSVNAEVKMMCSPVDPAVKIVTKHISAGEKEPLSMDNICLQGKAHQIATSHTTVSEWIENTFIG